MGKSFITATMLAVAVGSALLSGTALADTGGDGSGGSATNNCLNVGVNLLSGIGVLGQGSANGGSCAATANGTGGHG